MRSSAKQDQVAPDVECVNHAGSPRPVLMVRRICFPAYLYRQSLRPRRPCRGPVTGVNLSVKNLTNAKFLSTTLTGVNFSQASLMNADLRGATLTNANFSQANSEMRTFGPRRSTEPTSRMQMFVEQSSILPLRTIPLAEFPSPNSTRRPATTPTI